MLLLLVLLITLSSHPRIVSVSQAAGMESGTILSRYIVLAFALLFVLCINIKSMLRPKIVRTLWLMLGVIAVYMFATFAIYGKRGMMIDVRYVGFCIVAIMIGWQLNLDKKRFGFLVLFFSVLTLFVGLMQVVSSIGGFVIRLGYYIHNKNSLGVMLATGLFVFLYMGMNQYKKGNKRIILYGLVVFTLVVMLTIRARAAMVAAFLMALYLFYERYKGRNFFMYLGLGIIAMTFVLILLPQSWMSYFTDSFSLRFEGVDITAGRASRNRAAIQFLSEHPWVGNLNQNEDVGWIHNYPLNRTFEFGLVFVIPILVLYTFLLVKDIVFTVKSDNHNLYNLGYYLLLIPFIISMAEPTFPFGPGTATVFNFLMFGVALRNTYNESLIEDKTQHNDESPSPA